jgi:hydrogenase maturation protease
MSAGKTLVLGLGNPLRGDDGLGTAVIAALAASALPPHVDLLDGGTPGLETVLLWQGYERVLIVDAAQMNLPPGTWRSFSLQEAALHGGDTALKGTLHNAGLAEAVALAEALDALPADLLIFGVQPQETSWAAGLSEVVKTAVPAVCAAILSEIEKPPAAHAAPEASNQQQTV